MPDELTTDPTDAAESETPSSDGADTTPDTASDVTEPSDKDDEELTENGLKALKAERATRKTLETQVADLTAQLSEAPKPDELTSAQCDAARWKAIAELQLPVESADLVKGSTAEEINASAEALRALLGAQSQGDGERRRRTPDPSIGGGTNQSEKPITPDDWLRSAASR